MTKKIYNNKSVHPSDWTTKFLKENFKELNCSIEIVECYGVGDLILYDQVCAELEKRGEEYDYCVAFRGEDDEE